MGSLLWQRSAGRCILSTVVPLCLTDPHLSMSTRPSPSTVAVPVHLWVVGVVSLLWNAFGAMDYLMTQLQVEAYMSQFTPEQITYFYGFPAWVGAAWALGIWGSVAGSALILLRSRWAVWAFAFSIFGLIGTSIYTLVLTDGIAIMGGVGPLIFTVVVWVITIALFLYARAMRARGVLR